MTAPWFILLPLLFGLVAPAAHADMTVEPDATRWAWPVGGPVLRPFDPPEDPYGAGHRGIDIGSVAGTPILAPAGGTVAFAGPVGGQLFLTLDHGGGLTSTYSWLSAIDVRKGQVVARGDPVGRTGGGHPGSTIPHLHFGARLEGSYVDPMTLLGPPPVVDLIHLAPNLAPGAA
jgi:murein DD-endopeptidase MepM/ murein hydrolase activator NlpD